MGGEQAPGFAAQPAPREGFAFAAVHGLIAAFEFVERP
jgi:hypothetical protein